MEDIIEIEVDEHHNEECKVSSNKNQNAFVLNTKTVCFLCLNNQSFVKYEEEESSSQAQLERLSLRSICRYLKLNVKNTISKGVQKGSITDSEDLLEKISNCSVTLCEGCASITSKLSGLCIELELLQMKVDHCLQSFLDELEDSEMDILRVKKFRQLLVGPLEDIHFNVADILRKEVKKKCDNRLNSVLPKVVLSGNQDHGTPTFPVMTSNQFQISLLSPNNRLTPTQSPSIIYQQDIQFPESTTTTEYKPPVTTPTPPTPQTDQSPSSSSFAYRNSLSRQISKQNNSSSIRKAVPRAGRLTDKSKRYTCTICHPPRQVSEGGERMHKIRHHVDLLFASYQLPNISIDDFTIYCKYVLKVEVLSTKRIKNDKGPPSVQCPHCQSKYTYHGYLQFHLYMEHFETIGRKLTELQKSTSVDEIQAIKLPHFSFFHPSQRPKCNGCGMSFASDQNLKLHKLRACKLGPRPPRKRAVGRPKGQKLQRPYECKVCGKFFNDPGNFSKHRRFKHPQPPPSFVNRQSQVEVEQNNHHVVVEEEEVPWSPEVSLEMEEEYHPDDDFNYQSQKMEGEAESEEKIEGFVVAEPPNIQVDIDHNHHFLKTESYNVGANNEVPEYDPLQF